MTVTAGLFATAAGAGADVVPTLLLLLLLRARRGAAAPAGFFVLLGGAARCFSRWSTFSTGAAELEITKRVSRRSSSALVACRTGGDSIDMARSSKIMFLADSPLIPDEAKACTSASVVFLDRANFFQHL